MKAADNGDEIAGVLYGVPVRSGLPLDGIGTIGDGGSIRHDLLLGLGVSDSKEQAGVQMQPKESSVVLMAVVNV